MRAARQRFAKAKELHSLESLASAWLPGETLGELASLPRSRDRLITRFPNDSPKHKR